jgi:hypothetical protein
MNDSPRKVSPPRRRMLDEMRMCQLAPKTRRTFAQSFAFYSGCLTVTARKVFTAA